MSRCNIRNLTKVCRVAHVCMCIRYVYLIIYADGSSFDVSKSFLSYAFPFLSSIFMVDAQRSFMFLYQFSLLCKKLLEHHHKIEWEEIKVSSTKEFCMAASVFLSTMRRTTQRLVVGVIQIYNFQFPLQKLIRSV